MVPMFLLSVLFHIFSARYILLRYSEGAIFAALVASMATPIEAIWWSFFTPTPHYQWKPHFSIATVYVISGLIVMVPGVFLYNWFSLKEKEKEENKNVPEKKHDQDYERLE